jgi:hypothetical protein
LITDISVTFVWKTFFEISPKKLAQIIS